MDQNIADHRDANPGPSPLQPASLPSCDLSDPPLDCSNTSLPSPRRLLWRRFKKHRVAVFSGFLIVFAYLAAFGAEFVAPYDPEHRDIARAAAPPMRMRFWDSHTSSFHLRPFVYGITMQRDSETRQRLYANDTTTRHHLRFFVRGDSYHFWGILRGQRHLFGIDEGHRFHLFGTDTQGRDLLSRIIHASRISLTIGFVGVALSFTIGIVLGAISGYFGGLADIVIQRIIEVLISIPSLPLWMALSVAIPLTWSVHAVYFIITVILSLTGWTEMARVVRGKCLALRDEEFVVAARTAGAGPGRVMFRHLVPSFLSHIIAMATLAVPGMILGETALSFLGIGMRPPAISWGVLLKDAQSIQALSFMPWLLIPGGFVVIIVLAFNFLGDGMRDAADPHD